MTMIRQSTARTVLVGPVLDADGVAKTDEVVASIKVTKNGTVGAAHGSTTLTHDHTGKYKLAMDAGDPDTVGVLEISLNSGTNDMPVARFNVVEEAVYDEMYGPGATGVANRVLDAAMAGHNTKNTVGYYIRKSSGGTAVTIRSDTAQAGSANTITLDAGASTDDNVYAGNVITITSSTGVGQTRKIISYAGGTKVATVDQNWSVNPDVTSTFDITAFAGSVISDEGVAQAGANETITLSTGASIYDDIYNGSFVTITSGTGNGQTKTIDDYDGGTKVADVDSAWAVNPDATSGYAVTPAGAADSTTGTGSGPTAGEVVNEWETQSQADPTGFHINVKELDGSAIQQAGGKVVLADGVTHGGSTAKLRLGSSTTTPAFYVTNTNADNDSHAVEFAAGSGGVGGAGMLVTGGDVGVGFLLPVTGGLHAQSIEALPTTTVLTAQFTEIKGATWSDSTDTLEDIRDAISGVITQGNSAWTTATGFNTVVPPSVAQFNARTLVAANYATSTNLALVKVDTAAILVDTGTDGVVVASGSKTGYSLSTPGNNAVADAYLDREDGIETGVTPRQYMQRVGASAAGKLSGARSGIEVLVGMDGVTVRITATVDDSGNRTAIAYD